MAKIIYKKEVHIPGLHKRNSDDLYYETSKGSYKDKEKMEEIKKDFEDEPDEFLFKYNKIKEEKNISLEELNEIMKEEMPKSKFEAYAWWIIRKLKGDL